MPVTIAGVESAGAGAVNAGGELAPLLASARPECVASVATLGIPGAVGVSRAPGS